jgi:hypothetical protein
MKTKILLIAFILIVLNRPLVADENNVLMPETIVDVNFEFFMNSPKTAWGLDLFKKKPGFGNFGLEEEKFTLQGIVYDKAGATAVIDGKVVKSGDTVGERKIAEIGPNFVVLEKGDSQVELVLPPAKGKNR